MSKISVLIIGILLIATFQNCGKVQQNEVDNGSSNQDQPSTYNKFSVGEYRTYSIWDYKRSQYLDVDLDSGKVQAFPEAGNAVGQSYYLKDQELADAVNILGASEICEPIINVASESLACSQVYRYPYGILVNKNNEVRLGEMVNGCDKPIDLCADKGNLLKQWSSHIVENLDNGSVTK